MNRIIPCCLIEYGLCNFYSRGFTFYYHDPLALVIENHNVSSFLKLVKVKATFYLDQGFREFPFYNQKLDKMLPYPFFWC